MREVNFRKMHGLGNDFVIIDTRVQDLQLTTNEICLICDRHFGVGCDQLVMLSQSDQADIYVQFYNGDGSQSGACGNATRCVADILMNETRLDQCVIETDAGHLHARRAENNFITVNMGEPALDWNQIPLASDMDTLKLPFTGAPTAVNMGNPHCVYFVDEIVDNNVNEIGKVTENNELFPERTNVEFVHKIDENHFRQRTWERGAGVTLACGSGACAVAVAAIRNDFAQKDTLMTITLDGGDLLIEWKTSDNCVYMTGPVAHIFDGTLHLD